MRKCHAPLSLAILISGNGSNLQAIIDAIANGLPAVISVVISNQPHAYGLERAKQAGIPSIVIPHKQFSNHDTYDEALRDCVDRYQPDLIILAGFMRILGEDFVEHYKNRILNIHPSLLPKYPGLHTHQQVLEAKDAVHGATVHLVTAQLDSGAIIATAQTQVSPQDDINSLKSKVHALEHKLYPEVIRLIAQDQLTIKGDEIFLDGKKLPEGGLKLR